MREKPVRTTDPSRASGWVFSLRVGFCYFGVSHARHRADRRPPLLLHPEHIKRVAVDDPLDLVLWNHGQVMVLCELA